MERLLQRLKDQPCVVLAVNQQEAPANVFIFTWQLHPAPSFPILFECKSAVPPCLGVLGLPTSFIVDKGGRIVYRAMGGRDFDHPGFVRTIRELLMK